MEAASKTLKKITLELGGKNPAIFFDDCDMDIAVDWVCSQHLLTRDKFARRIQVNCAG
jgi:acyl-CoA reductase-like NAD-dependent aldehyde dehydrogenase